MLYSPSPISPTHVFPPTPPTTTQDAIAQPVATHLAAVLICTHMPIDSAPAERDSTWHHPSMQTSRQRMPFPWPAHPPPPGSSVRCGNHQRRCFLGRTCPRGCTCPRGLTTCFVRLIASSSPSLHVPRRGCAHHPLHQLRPLLKARRRLRLRSHPRLGCGASPSTDMGP